MLEDEKLDDKEKDHDEERKEHVRRRRRGVIGIRVRREFVWSSSVVRQ